MATDKKASKKNGKEDGDGDKPSLFKSKKFIIMVVAVLGVGGGVYKFMQPTPVVPPAAGETVPLDPTTVNLAAGHYLKIGVSVVLVLGKAALADFKTAPAAQLVIAEFANRTVASLSSNTAREALQNHLTLALQQAYPDPTCTPADLLIAASATTASGVTATPSTASTGTTSAPSATGKTGGASSTPTASSAPAALPATADTPSAATATLLKCTTVFGDFITQFVTQ